jgi:hypothetical protein
VFNAPHLNLALGLEEVVENVTYLGRYTVDVLQHAIWEERDGTYLL